MAYCMNCGKALLSGTARFCSSCGAPVPDIIPAKPIKPPVPEAGATAEPASNMSSAFTPVEAPLTRAQKLVITILCWLTIVGSLYYMLGDIISLVYYSFRFSRSINPGSYFLYEMMDENRWIQWAIVFFTGAGTLTGAVLMLNLKRVGYQLYLIFELISVVHIFIFTMIYYSFMLSGLITSIGIPVIFIILYTRVVKPFLTK